MLSIYNDNNLKRKKKQERKNECLQASITAVLRYLDAEDRIFNRVISDISVVLRETTHYFRFHRERLTGQKRNSDESCFP